MSARGLDEYHRNRGPLPERLMPRLATGTHQPAAGQPCPAASPPSIEGELSESIADVGRIAGAVRAGARLTLPDDAEQTWRRRTREQEVGRGCAGACQRRPEGPFDGLAFGVGLPCPFPVLSLGVDGGVASAAESVRRRQRRQWLGPPD